MKDRDYLITYQYDKTSFGNTFVKLDKEIDLDELLKITTDISEKVGSYDITIINIIRLPI